MNMRRDADDATSQSPEPTAGNVVGPRDTVYRESRDAAWEGELRITTEYHELSKDTSESVAETLANTIKQSGPPIVHVA